MKEQPKIYLPLPPLVEHEFRFAKGNNAYFDTIGIICKQALSDQDIRMIEATCSSVQHITRRARNWYPIGFKYTIQIPTPQTIHFLDWMSNTGDQEIFVNEVHLALDVRFDGHLHAVHVGNWLKDHAIKSHKRKNETHDFLTTRYFDEPKWGSAQMTIYIDKESRQNCQWSCAHMEQRVKGKQCVRRLGINCLYDLMTFDFQEYWSRNLRLRKINRRTLRRLFFNGCQPINELSQAAPGKQSVERVEECRDDQSAQSYIFKIKELGKLREMSARQIARAIEKVLKRYTNEAFMPANKCLDGALFNASIASKAMSLNGR
jgi:hypothetical protein